MIQTSTISAVRSAVKKADAMHGVYDCIAIDGLPHRFYVQHKEQPARCYLVDTRNASARCSCPAFEFSESLESAVCKHLAFAVECEKIAEGEALAEARAEFAIPEYAF